MVKIEPHADIREGAATMFQMFVAYQDAGFSEQMAFELVRSSLVAQIQAPKDEK